MTIEVTVIENDKQLSQIIVHDKTILKCMRFTQLNRVV